IASRTSPCECVVHSHIGLAAGAAEWSEPTVFIRICSTRPVQEPQEPDALVYLRTCSMVNRPFVLIARTIAPLDTPLQPQTSASSGIAAALSWRWCPASPRLDSPNMSRSRMPLIDCPERISLKYQAPSTVSPYRQAPTRRSPR